MSGVIDADGQQWEHCNECGEFVRIEDLYYEQPSERWGYGRDLCPACATRLAPDTSAQPTELLRIDLETGQGRMTRVDREGAG